MERKSPHTSDPQGENGFVFLARFPELWQADMAVSLLASEGIQAYTADEFLVKNGRGSTVIGGAGIFVHEGDEMAAWDILQVAERGELSLPEETAEFTDEWNRLKNKDKEMSFQRREVETRNQTLDSRHPSVRCPRCGSANNERKKGLKALFRPGYHCRVCHWEWKELKTRV